MRAEVISWFAKNGFGLRLTLVPEKDGHFIADAYSARGGWCITVACDTPSLGVRELVARICDKMQLDRQDPLIKDFLNQ